MSGIMAPDILNHIFHLIRKSKIQEVDQVFRCKNIHWLDCRYPSGDTPLHIAAQTGNLSVLEYLLEVPGTDQESIDVTNLAGKTALHEACQNSKPASVEFLVHKGANIRAIKQGDWTPLMLACTKSGSEALECCSQLISQGDQEIFNDRNKDGWNAFHIAVREGDTRVMNYMLHHGGFDQALTKSKNGRTPLHTAALHGNVMAVQDLLKISGVDRNACDSCGSTPLHDSVRSGSLETFQTLVEAGVDLLAHNNEGYGILHMAAQAGQVEMLWHILQKTGPGNPLNPKTTPLHCAVRAGQVVCVKLLLEYGVDSTILDSWGRFCYDIVPEKNVAQIKEILDAVPKSTR